MVPRYEVMALIFCLQLILTAVLCIHSFVGVRVGFFLLHEQVQQGAMLIWFQPTSRGGLESGLKRMQVEIVV